MNDTPLPSVRRTVPFPNEIAYLISICLMALSVSMCAAADFGVSMIVAPAYILSLKFPFLTFGQWEYVFQAVLFAVFCLLMRKFRFAYLFSFISVLFYGAVLDLFRAVIPAFNPAVTEPGAFPFWVRILLFAGGNLITAFAVAVFTRCYLYPQVYDFFVLGLTARYRLSFPKFKTIFDLSFLALGTVLSLVLFRGFRGIGVGTLITALLNGFVIGLFQRLLVKFFRFPPLFPKLMSFFRLDGPDSSGTSSGAQEGPSNQKDGDSQ
ncbi:MAG: hypothetical protein ILO68_02230 [Clostridia bacterium]|nr:hypothetical protein [Clostridia bacterium]